MPSHVLPYNQSNLPGIFKRQHLCSRHHPLLCLCVNRSAPSEAGASKVPLSLVRLLPFFADYCSLSRCRLFGFLLGTTLAGAGTYYYILDEYRVSNELLTEDIYVRDLYERVCI